MSKYACIFALAFLTVCSASAAEVDNTGLVLAIGKVGANICRVKVQNANFAGACNTAVYQEAYFTCTSTEGKEFFSMALAAYMGDKRVRITSDACSIYGSSVANVIGMNLE